MPAGKHWYPITDHDLLPFAHNFSVKTTQNAAAWGIPSEIVQDLAAKVAAYDTALAASDGPNAGHLDKAAKDTAKKELIDVMTAVKNEYIQYNRKITDLQRTELGLPEQDTTKTPHPAPKIAPHLDVEPTHRRQHTVSAFNPDTGTKEKPALVSGIRFAWDVIGPDAPKPAGADDLRHSRFQHAPVKVFDYPEPEYGKTAYYACCYENGKGEPGPWSDIVALPI